MRTYVLQILSLIAILAVSINAGDDPYGFEVPAMKDYIESRGIPVLYIEDQYSQATISRLRTRVQAFMEMIG